MPALACTGLPAAVNHCSNTLAGERATEEGQPPPLTAPALSKARATPQDPTSYNGAGTTSTNSFVGTRQTSSIPSKSVPSSVSSLRVNSEQFSGRARTAAPKPRGFGSNHSSATYQLCDVGQESVSLCFSFLGYKKLLLCCCYFPQRTIVRITIYKYANICKYNII